MYNGYAMFPEIKQNQFIFYLLFHPREQWLHPGYLAQYSEKTNYIKLPSFTDGDIYWNGGQNRVKFVYWACFTSCINVKPNC
jgi:hypothetical protein